MKRAYGPGAHVSGIPRGLSAGPSLCASTKERRCRGWQQLCKVPALISSGPDNTQGFLIRSLAQITAACRGSQCTELLHAVPRQRELGVCSYGEKLGRPRGELSDLLPTMNDTRGNTKEGILHAEKAGDDVSQGILAFSERRLHLHGDVLLYPIPSPTGSGSSCFHGRAVLAEHRCTSAACTTLAPGRDVDKRRAGAMHPRPTDPGNPLSLRAGDCCRCSAFNSHLSASNTCTRTDPK